VSLSDVDYKTPPDTRFIRRSKIYQSCDIYTEFHYEHINHGYRSCHHRKRYFCQRRAFSKLLSKLSTKNKSNVQQPAVQASPHLTLKAIYSRSLKSAKALTESAGQIDLYSDDSGSGKTFHDLLLRPDIQGVIIALPIANQPEYIEAALKAGKHVLSEKPVAENLKSAERLVKYYNTQIDKSKATWGVAENYRFLDTYSYASQEVQKMGKILGFKVEMATFVKPGDKYFGMQRLCVNPYIMLGFVLNIIVETDWRKNPTHQGGFLLDGGVHFVAGIRGLLGSSAAPKSISAYTALLQPHLPPVDTVYSIWLTRSGVLGTFSMSFGTTFSGLTFNVACEKGVVTISGKTVTLKETGKQPIEKHFPEQGSGVKPEVAAWAESLVAGKPDSRQSPEEALADLEILEKMLNSDSKSEILRYQI
jgi:predicted dehydrogenase